MQKEQILQVLDWLEAYGPEEGEQLSPKAFGLWLQRQTGEGANSSPESNIEGLISMHLGFMANYAAFYGRRVFKGSELYSFTDWAFLATLSQAGAMTKSALIQANILEKSTGTEVIKRLHRQQFIREEPNPEDRRARLVLLSEKGRAVLQEANERVFPLGKIITGTLSEKEKQSLLRILQKLHAFHAPLFKARDDEKFWELFRQNLP